MKLVRENIEFKRGINPRSALGIGFEGIYGLFKELLDNFGIHEIIFWEYNDSKPDEKEWVEIFFEKGAGNTGTPIDQIIENKNLASEWIDKSGLGDYLDKMGDDMGNSISYHIKPQYKNLFWRFIKSSGKIVLGTDTIRPGMLR